MLRFYCVELWRDAIKLATRRQGATTQFPLIESQILATQKLTDNQMTDKRVCLGYVAVNTPIKIDKELLNVKA